MTKHTTQECIDVSTSKFMVKYLQLVYIYICVCIIMHHILYDISVYHSLGNIQQQKYFMGASYPRNMKFYYNN